MCLSPVSFVEEVKVGSPAGGEDAEGREGIEIQQYPCADDSVDPSDGQQKAKRGDDRNCEKGHVYSVVTKTLKEKESVEVGIRPVLKRCLVKLLAEQGLWVGHRGKRTPSDSSRRLLPCRRFFLDGGLQDAF